ncbi:MAG: MGMT family protein [Bacillota bacterium]
MRIPYGTTATYGDIAQLVGKPRASRASSSRFFRCTRRPWGPAGCG